MNELHRRVYADMFHKHIELSVIPVLVDLRRWLQKHKSPYMKALEEYLHMAGPGPSASCNSAGNERANCEMWATKFLLEAIPQRAI